MKSIFIYHPLILLASFSIIYSATYYIDFDNGKDSNSGLSQSSAWQHAPGDENAGSNPANISLKPGDILLFRGGIHYRGSIKFIAEGTQTNPIIYKGDGWGGEKAILDGSEEITNPWKRCETQEAAGGNPNWQNMYYTTIPPLPENLSKNSALALNLYQDDEKIYPAYYPSPSDPFYPDVVAEYLTPQGINEKYIIDNRLAQLGGESLAGEAYVCVHHGNNFIAKSKIEEYISAENKLTFVDSIKKPYTGNDARYLLANHITYIDSMGEYYYSETAESDGSHKLFIWPYTDPEQSTFSYSVRTDGFDIKNYSYITIEGFTIQKYTGDTQSEGRAISRTTTSADISGIIIRNNEISKISSVQSGAVCYLNKFDNLLFENNYIHDNFFVRGVVVTESINKKGENIRIIKNRITRIGGTCIYVNGITKSYIMDNFIHDVKGVHTNGISTYSGCDSVLVANNIVINTHRPMTFNDADNIIIYNNIFHGNDETFILVSWGNAHNCKIYNNMILSAIDNDGLYINESCTNIDARNNIVDGNLSFEHVTRSHNLYTGLTWNMEEKDFNTGEFLVEDLNKIFVSANNYNFELINGSRAINKGIDITQYLPGQNEFPFYDFKVDILGNKRPFDSTWDIGAYEYQKISPILDKKHSYISPNLKLTLLKSSVVINCYSPKPCTARISFFNLHGKVMRHLTFKAIKGGNVFHWNACNEQGKPVGNGYYIMRFEMAETIVTRKFLLQRK